MNLEADLILTGGRILTWWDEAPEVEGVAAAHGRLLAVGTDAEVRSWGGPDTRTVDLAGRVALPGFVDAHTHLATVAGEREALDLRGVPSLEALLDRVSERAAQWPRDRWLLGRNWDESRWTDRRYPTRTDLDRAAPAHPVVLMRVDMHMAVANTSALERVDLADVEGVERDAQGAPTGVLKEEAAEAMRGLTQPGVDALAERLPAMIAEAHRHGVTSVSDTVRPEEIATYLRLHRSGALPLRVNLMPRIEGLGGLRTAGMASGLGGSVVRLGPLKAFLDGSLGSRTAALSEPFADEPGNQGRFMYGEGETHDLVREGADAGFQLALHAIGDRGIGLALDALADAPGDRHRIEHLELPSADHLKEMARRGTVASMQPNFIGEWSRPGGMYEDRLGPERLATNNPLRRVLDAGIPLALGSDMMPFGPLYGIHWAVNAPFPDQRITVEEALRAYTQGGAFAAYEEGWKGTLAPGMAADLAVLDGDPRARPDRIGDLRVALTVFDGRIVHRDG